MRGAARSGGMLAMMLALSAGSCLGGAPAEGAAKATCDFRPQFQDLANSAKNSRYSQDALFLEEKDFVTRSPALRLDCRNCKEYVVVANFRVPNDRLPSFRGKPLVYRCKVKWLEGEGDYSVTLRCWGSKDGKTTELVAATSDVFRGDKGKWTPFELHCMIPDRADVNGADFHTGLMKTSKPAVILLDECSVALDESGKSAPKRPSEFAAYEAPASAEPLGLVRDGRPAATIVASDPMSSSVRAAVEELNEHLELSTGVKLPVVKDGDAVSGPTVHVGKTVLTQRLGLAPEFLSPDHWVVQRAAEALILSGGDATRNDHPWGYSFVPFGTLYATYEFLERVVGVRWYWPGELGRVVPKHRTLTVGNVALRGAPAYDFRNIYYGSAKEFSGLENAKWWRRLRLGGVGGPANANHAFGHWNKKFGKEHPDWFALQHNGQRANNPDAEGCAKGHLCYTNPEVLKAAVAEKREFFDKYPAIRYAAVMDGDGGPWCQCPNCQALARPQAGEDGMYSIGMWRFVNQVAAEVRKTHPDRIITCCAYSWYKAMPEEVEFLPNVSVTLCVNHLPCVWKASGKADYLKLIQDWSKKTAHVYVWDYLYARRGVGVYGAPSIMPRAFKEWYTMEQGRVKGRVTELCEIYNDGKSSTDWADWMFDALNMYVSMKLLWNLDQDVEKMLEEHYELFYGPAAPLVRKFYDEMEAAWASPNNKGVPKPRWDWMVCWTQTYPPELIGRVMGYLREAEKTTRGNEPYHARAAKLLTGFLPFEAAGRRYTNARQAAIQNETVEVTDTPAAPTVDGKPDEACWQRAVVASGFVEYYNTEGLQAQTVMRFLRDKKNLYVAIQADLKDGRYKQTLPPNSKDDSVWDEESCELFLVQENKKYQFLIGPDSIYADNYNPDPDHEVTMDQFHWNCAGAQYKSAAGAKGWTAEISLPLASLDLAAPTKEKPWLVNFCRNHFYRVEGNTAWQLERSSWRPTFGSFHDVSKYGRLYFR